MSNTPTMTPRLAAALAEWNERIKDDSYYHGRHNWPSQTTGVLYAYREALEAGPRGFEVGQRVTDAERNEWRGTIEGFSVRWEHLPGHCVIYEPDDLRPIPDPLPEGQGHIWHDEKDDCHCSKCQAKRQRRRIRERQGVGATNDPTPEWRRVAADAVRSAAMEQLEWALSQQVAPAQHKGGEINVYMEYDKDDDVPQMMKLAKAIESGEL